MPPARRRRPSCCAGRLATTELYAVLAQRTAHDRAAAPPVVGRHGSAAQHAAGRRGHQGRQPMAAETTRSSIEELLPDLPARDVLQVGDRITHLQGRAAGELGHVRGYGPVERAGGDDHVDGGAACLGAPPGRAAHVADEAAEPQYERHRDRAGGSDRPTSLLDPATGRPQTRRPRRETPGARGRSRHGCALAACRGSSRSTSRDWKPRASSEDSACPCHPKGRPCHPQ